MVLLCSILCLVLLALSGTGFFFFFFLVGGLKQISLADVLAAMMERCHGLFPPTPPVSHTPLLALQPCALYFISPDFLLTNAGCCAEQPSHPLCGHYTKARSDLPYKRVLFACFTCLIAD